MKVCIHRGSRQIGGSCIEIAHDGARIALDFGLPLEGDPADKALLPPIRLDGLEAIAISHPHLDHYGLLHHLRQDVPVAMGQAARRIVRAAAPFTGQALPRLEGFTLAHRTPLDIGPFRITPYLMDHSAYDAYALQVEAGGKTLFYSGDLRGHGRKGGLFEQIVSAPPAGIDVLLMEGSSLSRLEDDDVFPSEAELEEAFVRQFRATAGLSMVLTSAQNIDRVVSLYRACKRSGRTLIIDLYAAAILEATGNGNIPQSDWPGIALFVPESQRTQIRKNEWFELLRRHAKRRVFPEQLRALASTSTVLFRPLMMADLERADALQDAGFIYSQWQGYLERGAYATTQAWLARHRISMHHIHTSGHASPRDLRRFAEALAPGALVPIHSFAPDKYAGLFANVVQHPDGEWWEV
ncbi:MAG: MBL fold metallo-hydrolase [Proteobacteria bacterium]|nr:MBL fold metallo-hydrolase [Pseudomonadota bacterium]